jgi:hypothetical protein
LRSKTSVRRADSVVADHQATVGDISQPVVRQPG